jgi:pyruvate dehydrogenase E1 component alpha subunit
MQARDPIPQFRNFVLKQSILSEAQIKDIDAEVEAIVDDAVKFADESPKPVRSPTLGNRGLS